MEYLTVCIHKKDNMYETILDDIFIPKQLPALHTSMYNLITYLVDIKALFRFVDPTKLTLRVKYGRKYYTYDDFCEMMEPGGTH